MARWLYHEGCVECGSKDNVGVYDDGSRFCFGCHWFDIPYTAKVQELKERLNQVDPLNILGDSAPTLPVDYTTEIPTGPFAWLLQYLAEDEIAANFIGYSPNLERIIFPIYDSKFELKMWTGRAGDGMTPKYYTVGRRSEVIHILSGNQLSDRLVVTEDLLSAIKVSRICSAMPIFGTKIPIEHARTLSKTYNRLVIWLDKDMRRESLKQAIRLESVFRGGVRVIFSEHDPKCYEEVAINNYLGPA